MRPIDGDRLMMSLADWWYSSFGEDETEEAKAIRKVMDKVEESLDAFTAQPERKKGKWIEADDSDNRISGRCSVCGWESHLYEDDVVGMDFCPNCGARMEDGQDGFI